MKIVITGISGFLGSALARRCLQDGHDVIGLVRETSRLERVRTDGDRLSIVSMKNDASIIECIESERPDAILHTACSYGRHGESISQILDVNLRLGVLLLEGAVRAGNRMAFLNAATVLAPSTNAYSLSKHQFSTWGRSLATFSSDNKLQFIDVLLQHMYGPGDDLSKFTAMVIRACRDGEPELRLTSGEQQRDFIYVDDVADAYVTIMGNLGSFAMSDAVDVGSGTAPTVRAFVETVHTMTHSRTVLRFGAIPYRPGEALLLKADLRRMRSIGWEPRFNLASGLRRILEAEPIASDVRAMNR